MLKRVVTKVSGLLWVTDGGGILHDQPQAHLIDGLARVCRTESSKLMSVTLALENTLSSRKNHKTSHFRQISQVLGESKTQSADDFKFEYIQRKE